MFWTWIRGSWYGGYVGERRRSPSTATRPRSATYLHLPDAGPVASPRCSTPDAGPAPGGTNRRHSGGQALSCPSYPHEAGTIEPMSSQPPSRPSHSSPKGLLQRLVEVIRIAISYFSSEGPPSSVPGPAPRGVNDNHHGHRTFLYAVVVVLVVLGAIVYLWVNGYLSAEVKFGILIGAVILLMIIMFLFGDEIGEYLFKLLLRLLTLPFVLLFRAGRGIWRALNKRSSRQATTYGQSPQTGYGQATSYGQAQSATQTGPHGIAGAHSTTAPGTPGPRGTQGTPPQIGYGTQSPHGTQPTPTTYGQTPGYGQSPQTGYGRPGATGYGTQPPYGQTG